MRGRSTVGTRRERRSEGRAGQGVRPHLVLDEGAAALAVALAHGRGRGRRGRRHRGRRRHHSGRRRRGRRLGCRVLDFNCVAEVGRSADLAVVDVDEVLGPADVGVEIARSDRTLDVAPREDELRGVHRLLLADFWGCPRVRYRRPVQKSRAQCEKVWVWRAAASARTSPAWGTSSPWAAWRVPLMQ